MVDNNIKKLMDFKTEDQLNGLVIKWKTVILYAIIIVSNFLPVDFFSPFFVLLGFFLIFKSLSKLNISYLKLVIPLMIVFITGIIGLSGHEPRDIFRDIFYALTPPALIYIGYWIAEDEKMWPKILEALIIAGIVIAIIHLSKFIQKPELLNDGIFQNRGRAANPNISLVALSLVLGIFQHRLRIGNLFPKLFPRFIAIPLLLLSFVLSFSRTGLIFGLILTISILGYIGSIRLRTVLSIVMLFGALAAVILTTPANEVGTFRSQIARSLKEVTVSNYKNITEITTNFRGYETYKAINTFATGNVKQIILGKGFGALVDLNMTMALSGVNFRKIPVLHNGYAYILVKTGILGIFCYIFFYFILLKYSFKFINSRDPEQILFARLLMGCTLSLMLTMFVVGGIAEIHHSEYVLLIGFIFSRMKRFEFNQHFGNEN